MSSRGPSMRTLAALNTQAHSVQPQFDFSLIQTNSRFMASNNHYKVVQGQRPDSNNSTQEHAVLPERIALTSCKCFVIGCFQAFWGLWCSRVRVRQPHGAPVLYCSDLVLSPELA